jgi:predicted alpha/beta superfamily hydrolase
MSLSSGFRGIILCIAPFVFAIQIAYAQLHILVQQIPVNTPVNASIYIAGNFNNWNPSDTATILNKSGTVYFKTLSITSNPIQFKFTRGSWQTVEGNQNGSFLPNRVHSWSPGDTLKLSILSWEDLGSSTSTAAANVSILHPSFFMPPLNRSRRIWLYLPPDYHATADSFPVLYMHDGQNLFDQSTSFAGEWQVDETLNLLHSTLGRSLIVVGIDNGGVDRINEYSPWVHPQYGGGQGDLYLDFISGYLKPYIDSTFRTFKNRLHTGMMGSSMGGLITLYGGVRDQHVYSRLGIFSPSYWFSSQVWSYPASIGAQHPMRIYQLAGGLEGNGSVAQNIAQMKQTLINSGFNESSILNKVVPSGQHNEAFWRQEFGEAVLWLFYDHFFMSFNEASNNAHLEVYPNPMKDSTMLKVRKGGRYTVEVSDLTRRLYYFKEQYVERGEIFLDVTGLPSGVYLLTVNSNDAKEIKKIIVQR